MSTQRPCPSCGATLEAADRFCPSCGRPADTVIADTPRSSHTGPSTTCPFCGQVNPAPASTCSSCGARIGEPAAARPPERAKSAPVSSPGVLQSWKFTVGAAAILVAALAIFVSMRQESPEATHQHDDPHDAGMMERIKELQARTDRNPDDADALLEFGNLLYDVRFYERAAAMYARYLELRPENADARVDMGTSYFQMAFSTDSSRGGELTAKAETCFLEAIRRKPNHQLAHFNLGIIHLHRGDVNGANEWFRKCVAIDPASEPAKRAQQLISQHVQNSPL